MTTGWEAPRAGYLFTLAVASGEEDDLWTAITSADGGHDLLIALGAQARLMARTATTATGKPFVVPASVWECIACPDVRSFAVAAYAGEEPGELSVSCTRCLREAAEVLARLQLAAMDAARVPLAWLAGVCGQLTSAGGSPVTPLPDPGAAVAP